MSLTSRQQLFIGIVLAVLLAITRNYHLAGMHMLPAASWAVFLLAGFYLRPTWAFLALFAQAILIDVAVLSWGQVSDICFTPAYFMLLPAYAFLWGAGRWYAKKYALTLNNLPYLIATVLISTLVCELLSSGSYYVMSGLFTPSMTEFISRELQYYPSYLANVVFYVGIAAIIHVSLAMMNKHDLSKNITH